MELVSLVTGIVKRCEKCKPYEIVDMPYLLGVDKGRADELFDYLGTTWAP